MSAEIEDYCPLSISIINQNWECFETLLKYNTNTRRISPLIHAIKCQRVNYIKPLIDSGFDVNKVFLVRKEKKLETSPLMYACNIGHIDCARALLDNGADVNQTANLNATALFYSIARGRFACVKLLLERGADISMTFELGELTMLMCSIKTDNRDIVRLLINHGADIKQQNSSIGDAVHYAVHKNRYNCLKILVDNGANIDSIGHGSFTPLMFASSRGFVRCTRLLIENGANVNHQLPNGISPLIMASSKGHHECVSLLLRNGADVNQIHRNTKIDSLHSSIMFKNKDCLSMLLDHGAKMNKRFKNPISGNQDTEDAACQRLVGVPSPSEDVSTIFREARLGNHDNLEALLNAKKVSPDDIIHVLYQTCKQDNHKCLKLLLDNGVNPKYAGLNGFNVFHYSCMSNSVKCLEVLFEHQAKIFVGCRADINARSADYKLTPLHYAVKYGFDESVNLLLKNGARHNVMDMNSSTPLHYACIYDQPKCVEILLEYGAEKESYNSNGYTPLYLASSNNHADCVKVLASQ